MQPQFEPRDRDEITALGIITQEVALLQIRLEHRRSQQKILITDLVQREVVSQSRAARIAEVQRSTIAAWVNSWPGESPIYQSQAAEVVDHYSLPDEVVELDYGPLLAGCQCQWCQEQRKV